MYTRICPTCGNSVSHTTKYVCKKSEGKECFDCAQKNPEKAKRVSQTNKGKDYNKSRLGVKESEETKKKKSLSLKGRVPGFGGKKHKPNTRQKMSEIRSQMLVERFGENQVFPYYNKSACQLFEKINKHFGWDGQHAENGGEFYIGGYWVDYYEPKQNIVIEFDEPRHDIPSIKEKDEIRQRYITEQLKCKFIRIKQSEQDDWLTIIEQGTK
jgi:hypothetical protein